MFNTGIKSYVFSSFKKLLLQARLDRFWKYTPFHWYSLSEIMEREEDFEYFPVEQGVVVNEKPPVIIGHPVSQRFKKYYNRVTTPLFVLKVRNGSVFGKDTNIIISADNRVVADVSREFGAEGGKSIAEFDVLRRKLFLGKSKYIVGSAVAISTCGSDNFHHWNYDVLPRFDIIKKAGLFDKVDFYLLNFKGSAFQVEGLKLLGIDPDKIINTSVQEGVYLKFDNLYVPSFTQKLSTISRFTVDFLRNLYLFNGVRVKDVEKLDRVFLSRRHVVSRKILNENEVMQVFSRYGFVEVCPEDYSVSEMALLISTAKSIASVHGSGLSNLAFISEGTKVLDILAPYHQDPYYWMICNMRKSKYVGLFAEGEHPPDDLDLVKEACDNDLLIDVAKLEIAIREIVDFVK